MRSTIRTLCIPTLALALAACGGGDGGGSDAGGQAGVPAGDTLGTSAVPGGALTLSRKGIIAPGETVVFTLDQDQPYVTSAELLIGPTWHQAASAGMTRLDDGRWQATVALPADLDAADCALVRLVLLDGSVLESAVGDFPLL